MEYQATVSRCHLSTDHRRVDGHFLKERFFFVNYFLIKLFPSVLFQELLKLGEYSSEVHFILQRSLQSTPTNNNNNNFPHKWTQGASPSSQLNSQALSPTSHYANFPSKEYSEKHIANYPKENLVHKDVPIYSNKELRKSLFPDSSLDSSNLSSPLSSINSHASLRSGSDKSSRPSSYHQDGKMMFPQALHNSSQVRIVIFYHKFLCELKASLNSSV